MRKTKARRKQKTQFSHTHTHTRTHWHTVSSKTCGGGRERWRTIHRRRKENDNWQLRLATTWMITWWWRPTNRLCFCILDQGGDQPPLPTYLPTWAGWQAGCTMPTSSSHLPNALQLDILRRDATSHFFPLSSSSSFSSSSHLFDYFLFFFLVGRQLYIFLLHRRSAR